MEPFPLEPFLGNHGADEVKGWVQSLRYFSFFGAVSEDHFQQDEELGLYLRFDGRDDLVILLDQLGILTHGDGTPPSVIAGLGSYNVVAFPDIVEPRDCTVAGVACNVVVLSNSILIRVKEGDSGVTAQRVADAQKIEALLDQFGFGTRKIPLDWSYVIGADRFT